jgi:hypothetical protein
MEAECSSSVAKAAIGLSLLLHSRENFPGIVPLLLSPCLSVCSMWCILRNPRRCNGTNGNEKEEVFYVRFSTRNIFNFISSPRLTCSSKLQIHNKFLPHKTL